MEAQYDFFTGASTECWTSEVREEGQERKEEHGEGEGGSEVEAGTIPPRRLKGTKIVDLSNKKIGLLFIESRYWEQKHPHRPEWNCICDCGVRVIKVGAYLQSARLASCGCQTNVARKSGDSTRVHGFYRTLEHNIWRKLFGRCYNEQDNSYARYGGRGIGICDRWRFGEGGKHPFQCFIDDMGMRPDLEMSLDRINNDLGYSPENCRWATAKDQARNTRRNVLYEWDGKMLTLGAICEITGAPEKSVYDRINEWGYTLYDAVTKPIRTVSKGRTFLWNGEQMSLYKICRTESISRSAMLRHLDKELSIDEAVMKTKQNAYKNQNEQRNITMSVGSI